MSSLLCSQPSASGNLYGAGNHGDDHHSEKGVQGENEVDHGILDLVRQVERR